VSERARSFDAVAAEYELHRPEYPTAALAWADERLDLGPGRRVLDVGAGTGKLTRGLIELGARVVAVEPGPAMLARLRQAVPEAEAYSGSAEAIPLPDASVDAAVAGQAYHWFDPVLAVPELHRVLRPGGGVALFWNWWDLRDPLQARLAKLLGLAPRASFGALPGEPHFAELERTTVESVRETTPDALVSRIATTSALLTAEPARRRALLDEARAMVSALGEQLALPQLTYVLAFRRLALAR
jgi:SAM-dependent methyltransferase